MEVQVFQVIGISIVSMMIDEGEGSILMNEIIETTMRADETEE